MGYYYNKTCAHNPRHHFTITTAQAEGILVSRSRICVFDILSIHFGRLIIIDSIPKLSRGDVASINNQTFFVCHCIFVWTKVMHIVDWCWVSEQHFEIESNSYKSKVSGDVDQQHTRAQLKFTLALGLSLSSTNTRPQSLPIPSQVSPIFFQRPIPSPTASTFNNTTAHHQQSSSIAPTIISIQSTLSPTRVFGHDGGLVKLS